MSDDIEKKLLEWAEEALELRHGTGGDPEGKIFLLPLEVGMYKHVEMLQRVRIRLDRVEELQAKARQAKGRVVRMREQADFEASIAYDTAMQQQGASRVREYVTAAEKNADASLASLEKKREAHRLKRLESLTTEVLDVIGQCYWGLGKLREDILQLLKLQQFATTEEMQT